MVGAQEAQTKDVWPDIYNKGYIHQFQPELTKFTSSSRSTEFKDALLWNISQMITKTIPISTRTVIRYAMKQNIHFELDKKSMETETTRCLGFPNGGKQQ